MNKDAVLFHLGEALEKLERTIHDISADKKYCREEFTVAI